MEAALTSAFEVTEAEFPFQLLTVTFDDPGLLSQRYEVAQGDLLARVRQPVLTWLDFPTRPLDQKPFLLSKLMVSKTALTDRAPHVGPRQLGSQPRSSPFLILVQQSVKMHSMQLAASHACLDTLCAMHICCRVRGRFECGQS